MVQPQPQTKRKNGIQQASHRIHQNHPWSSDGQRRPFPPFVKLMESISPLNTFLQTVSNVFKIVSLTKFRTLTELPTE